MSFVLYFTYEYDTRKCLKISIGEWMSHSAWPCSFIIRYRISSITDNLSCECQNRRRDLGFPFDIVNKYDTPYFEACRKTVFFLKNICRINAFFNKNIYINYTLFEMFTNCKSTTGNQWSPDTSSYSPVLRSQYLIRVFDTVWLSL